MPLVQSAIEKKLEQAIDSSLKDVFSEEAKGAQSPK
jgi:hypothetical protein